MGIFSKKNKQQNTDFVEELIGKEKEITRRAYPINAINIKENPTDQWNIFIDMFIEDSAKLLQEIKQKYDELYKIYQNDENEKIWKKLNNKQQEAASLNKLNMAKLKVSFDNLNKEYERILKLKVEREQGGLGGNGGEQPGGPQ